MENKEMTVKKKKGFLDWVEAAGNKMPHMLMFFLWMAIIFMVLSLIGGLCGWSATGKVLNNSTGEVTEQTVTVVNMLSREGLNSLLSKFNANMTGFAALGIYLVISVGLVTAEKSGFLEVVIRKLMGVTPSAIVTPMVVFLGVMSNIGSVVGYVVIPPLAAIMFKHHGRHPIAGMAAAFAGAAGGFSANLLIGPIDPLMSGITQQCAQIIDPSYVVLPTCNWFASMAATVALVLVGSWVTDKIVEPRLIKSSPMDLVKGDASALQLSDVEKKAMKTAGLAMLGYVLLIVICCIPQNSFLRNLKSGSLLSGSALMNGIIPLISLAFFIPGTIYGRMIGVYKNSSDVCKTVVESQKSCAGILGMALVAGQALFIFDSSKLGNVIAMWGANWLSDANIWPPILMIIFAAITFLVNIFISSASAKLLILGPVFIPMFMMLNISPAMTQFAYRIGDSTCNNWTPLSAYVIALLPMVKKYDDKAGMGTIISAELPYSIAFFIMWSIVLILWMVLDLPLGPGATVYMG